MSEKNSIEFKVWGRYALFTDPITRIGGEKSSYQIPTYEALKGIVKSIYWKPTFLWIIDDVRLLQRIRTQTKGMKPLKYSSGGNDLSIYTYLVQVEYQVRAHFEWNLHHPGLERDRNDGKHYAIAKRMLERGGRQDVFLGTRDCQGYIEPCEFGSGFSPYDGEGEVAFGLMFHGFDYPDETGKQELHARFWKPVMQDGRIHFIKPEQCNIKKFIRPMDAKIFNNTMLKSVDAELEEIGG
ncbi:MAG: type I-C CRISPR-associated protein Cas5 [Desulfobulbaceae bacterium]|nr:type I-C CRISPR-associated protein Cas5 [Desulfobulbaceae bacterium]